MSHRTMGGMEEEEKAAPEITYTSVGACMSRGQALNRVPGYCAVPTLYWEWTDMTTRILQ